MGLAAAPQSAAASSSNCGNVLERRAKLAVSFAVQLQEVDGAGCPQAKRRNVGSRGWLFAYFLAAESRSAGGPRPALCPWLGQFVNNEKISLKQKYIKRKQLSKQHRFVASDRGRESPRQASYLSCSHKKRNPKNATRPSASLRFAPGKPASRHSVCGAAKLTARHAAPFKHIAANWRTKHWHSSVPMPAA